MNKTIFTLSFLIFAFFAYLPVYSQNGFCGTDQYFQKQKSDFPDLVQNRLKIEEHTKAVIAGEKPSASRSVITIPVVFHVVYNANIKNISDAQVYSQLEVLNEDFRLANPNFEAQTPEVFKPLAADFEIEFCLAQRDPQGNPTNGINRYQTDVSVFSIQTDNVKFTSKGGADAWPSDQYLNIWVCDLERPVMGYASFPGSAPESDGVVLYYQAVGRPPANPYSTAYNLGKTAVHEIGHWLNLYHIWGNENDGCDDSDFVEDTPNQDQANQGIPTFPSISCNNGPNGDMFVNHMDYAVDICHSMFTKGQKQRAKALFSPGGARESLVSATTCSPSYETEAGCSDTLRFPFIGHSSLYNVSAPGTGTISGINSSGSRAKAEFFAVSGQRKQLKAAWFDFAIARQGTASPGTTIQFKVWSNAGSQKTPGEVSATATIPLSQIIADVNQQKLTYVKFDLPIDYTNGFFVGFEINPDAGYELALHTSKEGEGIPGSAWEYRADGTWVSYADSLGWNRNVSHLVFPYIEVPDMKATLNILNNNICAKQGTVISVSAQDHVVGFHWNFQGGTPATSDLSTVNVQYMSPGTYQIELQMFSTCFTDTLKQVFEQAITVKQNPPIPLLDYDGEKLVSDIKNGSFRWYRNNNLINGANEYFFIPSQNGVYKVSVTQNGCSSTSAPFNVDGLGIEESAYSPVTLFPNPSRGELVVKSKMKVPAVRVRIFDLSGQVVFAKHEVLLSADENYSFDFSFLVNGVYFIQFESDSHSAMNKFVILH